MGLRGRTLTIQSVQSSLFKGAIRLAQSLATAASTAGAVAADQSASSSCLSVVTVSKMLPLIEPDTNFEQFTQYLENAVIDINTVPVSDQLRLFKNYDVDNDGVLSASESEALNRMLINQINALKCALIVVDFQNDFVNGSLAIKKGPARQDPAEALVPLNRLLKHHKFDLVVYTQDWHPANHISFYEHCRNADRCLQPQDKGRKLKPFDVVNFETPKCIQTLYPAHCLQNSWGAELSPHLTRVPSAKFVRKGLNVYVDAYSAFSDNNGENISELLALLRSEGIDGVFICGLAYEICVAATARDASKLGFYSALLTDCTRGLDAEKIEKTNVDLRERNIAIVSSKAVDNFIAARKVPWSWICQMSGIPATLVCSKNFNNNVTTNNSQKVSC